MLSFSPRLTRCLVLAVALFLPFGMLQLFPRVISWDISSFRFWAECLSKFTTAPYSHCAPEAINYPTVGLYASGGVVRLLQDLGLDRAGISLGFQIYLGVFDALNILVMYLLLRGLRVRGAHWATLVFAALPSTRVGGNLWGQIDGVSQFFLSLGLLLGFRALRAMELELDKKALRYFSLLSLSVVGALLTKQLVIFSMPALVTLWIAIAWKLKGLRYGAVTATVSAFALLLFIALDQIFPTPPGYYGSGVFYVLSTGSAHADRILHNGVSIFASLPLVDSDPSKGSYPLFSLRSLQVSILPFYFGLTLFLALTTALLLRCLRGVQSEQVTSVDLLALSLIVAAGLNLFMNTALTGTHERYLYHYGFFAYPFLVAFGRFFRYRRLLITLAILHLSLYGAFVYHILMGYGDAPMTLYLQQATVLGNLGFSAFLIYAAAFWRRVGVESR